MASTLVPLFGPIPGGMEMFVILLIAVLLFGANKIPKLARSTGQAMGEFQKGRQEVEQELEQMEESMDPNAEVESDDSTVDLDDEQPDEEFELDDENQSSN
ncbi:Sec-independent protein translocase subunit TatA/TatB [Halovenus halobia]|uniref:Sec-independent protein translocase subunit TatA/TatB n=1 Tax=Halovenus halobia TaxID=3396622 RepID=UPI003F55D543